MIRISVTDLESFRYWREQEHSTVEELVARLRHEEPPSPQMAAGGAFAKLMETAQSYPDRSQVGDCYQDVEVDGWRFVFELDAELELPDVRELKAEQVFQTSVGPVMLVGKVDGLDGLTVHDQKLTESWDAEKYVDSLQWRAYLVMFEAQSFVYDVFVGRYKRDRDRKIIPGQVTVTDYHRMAFYAYPGVRADVQRAVENVAAIIAHHIPERVLAA